MILSLEISTESGVRTVHENTLFTLGGQSRLSNARVHPTVECQWDGFESC